MCRLCHVFKMCLFLSMSVFVVLSSSIQYFFLFSLLPCLVPLITIIIFLPDSAHFVQPQNATNKTSHLVHSTNNFSGLSGVHPSAAAAAQQLQQQHQSAQQHHAGFNHNPNVSNKKDSRCVSTLLYIPLCLDHLSPSSLHFDSLFPQSSSLLSVTTCAAPASCTFLFPFPFPLCQCQLSVLLTSSFPE